VFRPETDFAVYCKMFTKIHQVGAHTGLHVIIFGQYDFPALWAAGLQAE